MTGYVYTHPGLTVGELRGWIEKLEPLEYAIQETKVRIQFIRFEKIGAFWDKGRAFGESCEVRWQKQGDTYRVQVLSEGRVDSLAGWPEKPQEMDAIEERTVWLWGRHWYWMDGVKGSPVSALSSAWTEALISGRDTLSYPLEPVEFVYLRTVDYRLSGITRLTRFKGLSGQNRAKKQYKEGKA